MLHMLINRHYNNMIKDLQYYLQQILHTYDESFVLSFSSLKEYDYQSVIKNMTIVNKQDELLKYLKDNNVDDIFDYLITSNAKVSFVCFTIKESYLKTFICNDNLFDNAYYLNNKKKCILYDYSSPNLSKDMHVGHLRSTIIGDCLANISEYLGNDVIRINHIGDFGLPFGMIIEYIIKKDIIIDDTTSLQNIYILAKEEFEKNSEFNDNSYVRTAELQKGDKDSISVKIWNEVYEHSLRSYDNIYKMLNISKKLTAMGESYYVPYIDTVQKILSENNMLFNDEHGRLSVSISNYIPMTYKKSDSKGSSFTYDTTDITALWFRLHEQKADEIYYVVDSGQSLHFKQLFQVAIDAKWNENKCKTIEHINFGVITGKNKQRIKSRSGDTPKLLDLINDGIEETKTEYLKRHSDIDELFEDEKTLVRNLAIGSIKYYDLSKCRETSYQFNFDEMLKLNGNTYTYIIYSLARCRGIIDNFNKISSHVKSKSDETLSELDILLLRKISQFPTIINKVMITQMPHYLCTYVNNITSCFNEHYTNCRCIQYDGDTVIDVNVNRIHIYMCFKKLIEKICTLLGLPIVDKI